MDFFLIITFLFNILKIWLAEIAPCLKIVGLTVKSTIVDSNPILQRPPSSIKLTLLPNSSTTSLAQVGLNLEEIFALGAARGNFNIFNNFLITVCFGILIATVFFLANAILDIFDLVFLFSINVIGPGQKASKSFIKFLLTTTSFYKSLSLL